MAHARTATRRTRGRWATRANALTAARAVCAPLLVAAIAAHAFGMAVPLFALAVLTDWLDGRVARRRGEDSPLGGLLDHAADAFFVISGLGALASIGLAPSLLPVLVAIAFLQYAADSRVDRGAPLRASRLGRWNGIAYYALVGAGAGAGLLGLAEALRPVLLGLGWGLVATTALSIVDRVLAWRRSRARR